MSSVCDDFSDTHIRSISKSIGISTVKKTKEQLCNEIKARRGNQLPAIPPVEEDCKAKSLSLLKFQAKQLNVETPDMYTDKTKQMLCNKIQEALKGKPDPYADINPLGRSDCEIDGVQYNVTQLREKASQMGLVGTKDLDKSSLCFLIKKELERISSGGSPKKAIRSNAKSKIVHSTYNQFVIDPEIERELTVAGQSSAITSIKLRPAQMLAAEYLSDPNHRGLTLVHEVGTGKTFSAINTSQILLRRGIVDKVFIITPTSLQYNFIDQFSRFNPDLSTDHRYQYFTPTQFMINIQKNKIECDGRIMIIIDEAHNYRTYIYGEKPQKKRVEPSMKRKVVIEEDDEEVNRQVDQQVAEVAANQEENMGVLEPQMRAIDPTVINQITVGNRVRAMFKFIKTCPQVVKVLLLTATPFVNNLYDVENLIGMMSAAPKPRLQNQIKSMADYDEAKTMFHVYRTSEEYKSQFPKIRYHTKIYRMSPEYYESYTKIEKNVLDNMEDGALYKPGSLSAFFNGVRRAANVGPDLEYSDKLAALINMIVVDIRNNPTIRILIYSTWLETGLSALQKAFSERKIASSPITGKLSKLARRKLVEEYNTATSYKILMISKAGGEGLDLKKTNKVYILEPTWNEASIQQIIGRAARHQSHKDLPAEQQFVDVYKMMLLKPFEAIVAERKGSDKSIRMFEDNKLIGKYDEGFFAGDRELMEASRVPLDDQILTDRIMSIDLYLYKFLKKKQTILDTYMDDMEINSEEYFDDIEELITEDIAEFYKKYPAPIGRHEEKRKNRVVIVEDEPVRKKIVVVEDEEEEKPKLQVVEEEIEPGMLTDNQIRELIRQEIREMFGVDEFKDDMEINKIDMVPLYDNKLKVWRMEDVPLEIRVKFGEIVQELPDKKKVQIRVLYHLDSYKKEQNGYIKMILYYLNEQKQLVQEVVRIQK